MEVAEMKMLRFSLGKTRMDRVCNEEVRGTLGIERLSDKLRERRLGWLGQVCRRDGSYVGQRVRIMTVDKSRNGSPKRRWCDCIREDLAAVGASVEDAVDRAAWRHITKRITPATPS